jgi:pimeloyl-ACP methyl ester carboxylesterase
MRPLLMIHGIAGCAREAFGAPGRVFKKPRRESMYSFLVEHGYTPGKDLFWYTYPTFRPIPRSAMRLQAEIEHVQQVTGLREVDLLTFSLGGIIAKYYTLTRLYQGELRRMIMVAPPFLGSRWADWFRAALHRSGDDFLIPGDGRSLSPALLAYHNPFLMELARRPFPPEIETSIIAGVVQTGTAPESIAEWVERLTGWLGAGDMVVPLESTRIPVNHYITVKTRFSLQAHHRYLLYHPEVQREVGKRLKIN